MSIGKICKKNNTWYNNKISEVWKNKKQKYIH